MEGRRQPPPFLLLGGYLVLAGFGFLVLFSYAETDDFAGWVPAFAVLQILWVLLVGTTPRPTARIGARAGIAAGIAGLFVLACGVTSLAAPVELLHLRLREQNGNDDLAVAGFFVGLAIALVAALITSFRFARLLAPVSTRGVIAVLTVVAGTGLWSLAVGLTVYPLIPQRPWGILDGFTAILAGMCGVGALIFSLPLFLYAWHLARRPAVDTTPAAS